MSSIFKINLHAITGLPMLWNDHLLCNVHTHSDTAFDVYFLGTLSLSNTIFKYLIEIIADYSSPIPLFTDMFQGFEPV